MDDDLRKCQPQEYLTLTRTAARVNLDEARIYGWSPAAISAAQAAWSAATGKLGWPRWGDEAYLDVH